MECIVVKDQQKSDLTDIEMMPTTEWPVIRKLKPKKAKLQPVQCNDIAQKQDAPR